MILAENVSAGPTASSGFPRGSHGEGRWRCYRGGGCPPSFARRRTCKCGRGCFPVAPARPLSAWVCCHCVRSGRRAFVCGARGRAAPGYRHDLRRCPPIFEGVA